MMGLGFLMAFWLAKHQIRKNPQIGLKEEVLLDVATLSFLAGIIGARLLYVTVNFKFYMDAPIGILKIWEGGLILYGGLVLGVATSIYLLRRRKLPILSSLDLVAPSIALGLGFGRIGCFLNGCCFGKVCPTGWKAWGIHFPSGSPTFKDHLEHGWISQETLSSLAVYPTQLFEAVFGFLLCLYLAKSFGPPHREGRTILCLLISYAAWRFLIEFLRGDNTPLLLGLTLSQLFSLLGLTIGLIFWWKLRRPMIRS